MNMNHNFSIRRLGVLTGGGDCPGLNAVIRAVAKTALGHYGLEVVGVEDGFQGLIQNRLRVLRNEDVSNILTLGGTILGTNNKCDPRRYAVKAAGKIEYRDVTDRVLGYLEENRLDALVVIGGDGTMTVASHFVRLGVPCVGVPKTIDNDLCGTDVTFGFATAVSIATEALDRVHTTAASHHRVMIVEVMGRNAGWLALHAGIASGSDVILLPEFPYDLAKVCEFVYARSRRGKRFSIICVSEGAKPRGGQQVVARLDPTSPDPVRLGGIGQKLAGDIEQATGIETRYTVLGHVQRGGTPVAADRVLATQFGNAAMHVLMGAAGGAAGGAPAAEAVAAAGAGAAGAGPGPKVESLKPQAQSPAPRATFGRLVVLRGPSVTDIELTEVEGKQRLVPVDHPLVLAARNIGTCFGD